MKKLIFLTICFSVLSFTNLNFENAKKMAEYIIKISSDDNEKIAVSIIDKNSDVLVIYKNDDATNKEVENAKDKAFTALRFQVSTSELKEKSEKFPIFSSISKINFEYGGIPIKINNETIGAIGIDGSSKDYLNEYYAYMASEYLQKIMEKE